METIWGPVRGGARAGFEPCTMPHLKLKLRYSTEPLKKQKDKWPLSRTTIRPHGRSLLKNIKAKPSSKHKAKRPEPKLNRRSNEGSHAGADVRSDKDTGGAWRSHGPQHELRGALALSTAAGVYRRRRRPGIRKVHNRGPLLSETLFASGESGSRFLSSR